MQPVISSLNLPHRCARGRSEKGKHLTLEVRALDIIQTIVIAAVDPVRSIAVARSFKSGASLTGVKGSAAERMEAMATGYERHVLESSIGSNGV
jgi:hypothetical protein